MKFYSEITKELYDSPDQLQAAEEEMLSATTEADDILSYEELLNLVYKEIEDAEKEYAEANKKVTELSNKYLKAVDEIMTPVQERLTKAYGARKALMNSVSEVGSDSNSSSDLAYLLKLLLD